MIPTNVAEAMDRIRDKLGHDLFANNYTDDEWRDSVGVQMPKPLWEDIRIVTLWFVGGVEVI